MGNKTINSFVNLIIAALLAGCLPTIPDSVMKMGDPVRPSAPIKSVALVSLAIRNDSGGLSGQEKRVDDLINAALENLVAATESTLSGVMRIDKVSDFIGNPSYRDSGVNNTNPDADSELGRFMIPRVNGMPMEIFSRNIYEMNAGYLNPEVARKLCADLKVDGVVVAYSLWSLGGRSEVSFNPTLKAQVLTLVTVWDRDGKLVYRNRAAYRVGDAIVAWENGISWTISDRAIEQWSTTYLKDIEQAAQDMKRQAVVSR